MTPETLEPWIAVFRNVLLFCLAAFMLVYETVYAHTVNPYLVGAGLTLAGVAPALLLDKRRKTTADAEDQTGGN